MEKYLTTKLVFPIWQSPKRLILRETNSAESKSESESNPPLVVGCSDEDSPSATAGGNRDESRRYFLGALADEQAKTLSHIKRKKWRTRETRSRSLHRTSLRQSLVMAAAAVAAASWVSLAAEREWKWRSLFLVLLPLVAAWVLILGCICAFGDFPNKFQRKLKWETGPATSDSWPVFLVLLLSFLYPCLNPVTISLFCFDL